MISKQEEKTNSSSHATYKAALVLLLSAHTNDRQTKRKEKLKPLLYTVTPYVPAVTHRVPATFVSFVRLGQSMTSMTFVEHYQII